MRTDKQNEIGALVDYEGDITIEARHNEYGLHLRTWRDGKYINRSYVNYSYSETKKNFIAYFLAAANATEIENH